MGAGAQTDLLKISRPRSSKVIIAIKDMDLRVYLYFVNLRSKNRVNPACGGTHPASHANRIPSVEFDSIGYLSAS